MKRTPNKVAVESLLSTIPANQVVKIADIDRYMYSSIEPWSDSSSSIGLTYTVDEILHHPNNTKIAKAQIHRTAINEGLLLLVIDTKHEEY